MNPTSVAPAGPLWRSPPDTLAIGCDEIHVWRASLDQTPLQVASFLLSLAADEKARAERFYFARDRGHFIVARGVLRAILGRYMNSSARTALLPLRRSGEAGARRRIRRRCDPLQPLPLPWFCPLRDHQGPPGRHRPRTHQVRRRGRGNRRPVFPSGRSRDAPGASSRHATSGVLSLLDAQGGLDQGPGRGIAL